MEYEKFIVKKPNEIVWPFKGSPRHKIKQLGSGYFSNIEVDPFPCNTHNADILRTKIDEIEKLFPIGTLLQWISLPHEVVERVNAWAQSNQIWGDHDEIKKKHRLDASIVFSGKRANIHPAMTKFLVAHEYGHAVDSWINSIMKEEENNRDENLFHKKYAEMRGLEWKSDEDYGGGNYHDTIVEIIADDFRIVVGKTDPDFYQHSCGNPVNNWDVIRFWDEMREKYGFDNWWPKQNQTEE